MQGTQERILLQHPAYKHFFKAEYLSVAFAVKESVSSSFTLNKQIGQNCRSRREVGSYKS